jgi:hypothetical protein
MNRPAELSAKTLANKTLANMPKQDLRTWIAQLEAADDVQLVRGANRDAEIGGIVDVYQRQAGNRAVLFDDILAIHPAIAPRQHPDLDRRIKMTLGLPADATDMDLIALQLREGTRPSRRSRCRPGWSCRMSIAATTSTSPKSRRRNGMSTTAATTSAPATW